PHRQRVRRPDPARNPRLPTRRRACRRRPGHRRLAQVHPGCPADPGERGEGEGRGAGHDPCHEVRASTGPRPRLVHHTEERRDAMATEPKTGPTKITVQDRGWLDHIRTSIFALQLASELTRDEDTIAEVREVIRQLQTLLAVHAVRRDRATFTEPELPR